MSRGLTTKEAINAYLFSSLEQDVAHPALLKDAQKAVDRIIHAINTKEKILVFGDYDVDGITSSALMMLCLLPLGANVNFFLPVRTKDGYGLSSKIVKRAAENSYNLLITVDNGITAFEPARLAKKYGIDLIITDHHKPHHELPEAFAIINPQQEDCAYPFKGFAGVGVSFKILSLLYECLGKPLPAKAYELLLLGTIADVVPLVQENRFWVRHCLQYVNGNDSLSLTTLKNNGKVTKAKLSSLDIGFNIAPQINALGRLEDPRQGVKFLIGNDQTEVETVGKILLSLNQARREIEQSIVAEVQGLITQNSIDLSTDNVIIAGSEKWPAGVIGLVASRLVSAHNRPTLLFHLTEDGLAKGSCRSMPEFNIFNALQSAQHLLISFGGHACAAGLSLKKENLPALKEILEAQVAAQLTEDDLKPKIRLDAETRLTDLTKKFMSDMEHLEPFGHQNAQPLFYIRDVTLVQKPTLLKNAHVKCLIFADGVVKPIMFFNRPELFELLIDHGDKSFSVAAQVVENHWQNNVNIELHGTDVTFF
jgi:single-stranded-DNA-specific exonuclease